jgi:beta-glucanase (GH16 family)
MTKGKQDWKYGKFVIRANLSTTQGVWSAIWMMPTDTSTYGKWPKCGEIDIMENVGYDPDTVEASFHTGSYYFTMGTQKHDHIAVPDCNEVFHDYILECENNEYRVYVDDTCYITFKNEGTGFKEWPFDQPFYLILNMAYGGNRSGARGLELDKLPQRMEIDFMRIYQKKNLQKS